MIPYLKKQHIHISKNNSNCEKEIIILINSNGEAWHYLAAKKEKLSALLRGTMSKHHGDFYCLNCLHSFAIKNKLESRKKVYENEDFYNIVISSEDTKIL